eukprot:431291_1
MPTRHAKNNTSLGFFTRKEKDEISKFYGTQKQRVGAGGVKDFDACSVCLKQATQPLSCPKGHMFCRECIFNNLLEQIQGFKEQETLYEIQQQKKQSDADEQKAESLVADLEKFDRSESGLVPTRAGAEASQSSGGTSSSASAGVGQRLTENRQSSSFGVNAKDKGFACFWIPQLIPDPQHRELKKPVLRTVCPADRQRLKKKQLFPIRFLELSGDEAKTKKHFQTGRYMCPACRKTLTNSCKTSVLRKCGHVFCNSCVKKFIEKNYLCVQCDKPTRSKDVIPLEVGGTGFAGHGAQVESKKSNIAFLG